MLQSITTNLPKEYIMTNDRGHESATDFHIFMINA